MLRIELNLESRARTDFLTLRCEDSSDYAASGGRDPEILRWILKLGLTRQEHKVVAGPLREWIVDGIGDLIVELVARRHVVIDFDRESVPEGRHCAWGVVLGSL